MGTRASSFIGWRDRELDDIERLASPVHWVHAHYHLVVPDLVDPVHIGAAEALQRMATERGSTFRLSLSRNDSSRIFEAAAIAAFDKAMGLVAFGEPIAALDDDYSVVFVCQTAVQGRTRNPQIQHRYGDALQAAVERGTAAGHDRVTVLDANVYTRSHYERCFTGISPPPDVTLTYRDVAEGLDIDHFLDGEARAATNPLVVVSDDRLGSTLLAAAERLGVRVAVAGYNHQANRPLRFPSIDQRIDELLLYAFESLKGALPPHQIFPEHRTPAASPSRLRSAAV